MYHLFNSLSQVKGIGPNLATTFAQRQLTTVKDLLTFLPLRYEDRSQRVTISQLQPKQLVTFSATVVSTSNFYRGRRSIQSAVVKDETGKIKLMWFNNRFVLSKLITGKNFLFSGELGDRGVMVQPVVEDDKIDTIHTDRLVPIYSTIPDVKQGNLRRLLYEILQHLEPIPDPVVAQTETPVLDLTTSFHQLHFPDTPEKVVAARERLALEELLGLIKKSQDIKNSWEKEANAPAITLQPVTQPSRWEYLPSSIPFELTADQLKVTQEIFHDLQQPYAMNRLLVGDVGSGKTVVAGLAALQMILNQHSAALIAPTRILAEQHFATLKHLFPDVSLTLVTSQNKLTAKEVTLVSQNQDPTLYIGTHALLTHLAMIKPGLIIYDEQHRFGVNQRSEALNLPYSSHILTMSATPIPRSLMLTIFSHLSLSTIDELPAGRKPTKTWVVPKAKRDDAFTWIAKELSSNKKGKTQNQAIVVCPFIDPSNALALENVAAVNDTYEKLIKFYKAEKLNYIPKIGLLHSRLKKTDQAEVIEKLYAGKIDLLVTTPIVEVGVDLPKASIIVIEAADRFGLASLHQLRGRVGRAGQQGYCLLFSSDKESPRLEKFSQLHKGSQIAELDLEYRGAGDIFGTQQHGFDQLQFASWANTELISQARKVFEKLPSTNQPLFYQKMAAQTPLSN